MIRYYFSRTGCRAAILALGATALLPQTALAQAAEFSLTSATLKMVGVLALVLALLLGLLFVLKKVSPRFGRGGPAGAEMDLLAQYPLGPKKTLAVVRVGDQVLLLGVTEASINLLIDIQDQSLIDRLLRKDNAPVQGFSRLLKKAGQGLKEGAGQ